VTPVSYSAASQTIVDAYNAQSKAQKSATYWSDDAVKIVRKEIKDHYIAEQAHRCAYCHHPIYTNNNAVWDAEHVISKQRNPEFMFEPRNLAISCKDCNIAKGEQEVRNTQKVSFPETSPEYKIVHPHFDNYEDHIRWAGPVCIAVTADKGSKTIAMCNLTRYAAMQIGEIQNIMDDDFNELLGQLMGAKSPAQGRIVAAGILALLRSKAECLAGKFAP
jgi:5-methylcytosine-specific restriction endonuclease McrA